MAWLVLWVYGTGWLATLASLFCYTIVQVGCGGMMGWLWCGSVVGPWGVVGSGVVLYCGSSLL